MMPTDGRRIFKVLVVDDEKWVRRGIIEKADWKSLGAEVVGEARNGVEGLELARKLRPDIVIADMRMPVMSGAEFIARLRKETPGTRVIVISGYADYCYTRQALLNKAVDYILKPIEPSVINEVMGRAIRELGAPAPDAAHDSDERPGAAGPAAAMHEVVRDVIDYIDCHYNERISLEFVAKRFHVSGTYFCKMFKKETGRNFHDHLRSVRMKKARTLIEDYRVRKYEAAYLVGYEDARHFSKLYRQHLENHME